MQWNSAMFFQYKVVFRSVVAMYCLALSLSCVCPRFDKVIMTYLVDLSALLLSSGSSICVTWAIADRTGEVVNYAQIAENPLLSRCRHAAPATFLFISVWSANKKLQIDGNPQLMGRNAISMPWRKLMWQRNLTVFSVLFSGSADWFTVWLPCLAREEKKRQVFEIQHGSSKDLSSLHHSSL